MFPSGRGKVNGRDRADYEKKPSDEYHVVERDLMTLFHMSIRDINDATIDSVYGLLGYIARVGAATDKNVITLGKKKYRRVTADEIQF